MKRIMFSASKQCPLGCKYCFAKWDNYPKQLSCNNELNFNKTVNIVYPCCDGEFFLDENWFSFLEGIINKVKKRTIISISTKLIITEDIIKKIADLNKRLLDKRLGFIKIAISISNRSKIQEIEPGTSTFEDRLNSLKLLSKYNIQRSVTLKPILPFITKEDS